MTLQAGARVVVRTPDRREYRGRLLDIQTREDGRRFALVRLDTGWETTYPLHMVEVEKQR